MSSPGPAAKTPAGIKHTNTNPINASLTDSPPAVCGIDDTGCIHRMPMSFAHPAMRQHRDWRLMRASAGRRRGDARRHVGRAPERVALGDAPRRAEVATQPSQRHHDLAFHAARRRVWVAVVRGHGDLDGNAQSRPQHPGPDPWHGCSAESWFGIWVESLQ